MNITVESKKHKEIREVNSGDIVRLVGIHHIVTDIEEDGMILVSLSTGKSVRIYEGELINYINDEKDSTALVTEADLTIVAI